MNASQNLFFKDLSSLNLEQKVTFINKCAKHFGKQEIMFKLWTILNLGRESMCDEIFFYGIDLGYIAKEESFGFTKKIYMGKKTVPINLPETGECVDIDKAYKGNNWKNFRISRRRQLFNNSIFESQIAFNIKPYFFDDNVEMLQKEMKEGLKEYELEQLLNQAVFTESVKLFKHLLMNGAKPSNTTMVIACGTGNEEILQILIEIGKEFTEECLIKSIECWNIGLAKWIIEER